MKGIKLKEPRNVDCVELEKPVPGPGEALIRIVTAGICGSDIGAFRGTNTLVSYPRIIGHELAGIVEEIPADNPKGLKPGDKVIVDPYIYCGECYPCSIGRTNCCTSLKVLGVHIDGGMAEYFCHPADMLVKMPEDMDWTDAAMAEPLTISLHGIHRGGLKAGGVLRDHRSRTYWSAGRYDRTGLRCTCNSSGSCSGASGFCKGAGY